MNYLLMANVNMHVIVHTEPLMKVMIANVFRQLRTDGFTL